MAGLLRDAGLVAFGFAAMCGVVGLLALVEMVKVAAEGWRR